MRTRIKFCGCTSWIDASMAIENGADAIGMIFAPSPRRIAESAAKYIAEKLPPFITPVGVFVNPTRDELVRAREIFPDLVLQFSGDEASSFLSSVDGKVMKALHVDPNDADADALARAANAYPRAIVMFDTSAAGLAGGTGVTFPWKAVASIARSRPIIVAGGLTPENVAECVRAVRPFGVDVRSGIESDGRKDEKKMRAFVRAVRDVDAA
ncbi:MAG: phosphoribosylanthranilate isomerase [Candidatus Eremiobacteraeota bacterium]|nr:phosphoribosylanthranilate isomerase [Candidatus Eremiobacteraeota bacterium]